MSTPFYDLASLVVVPSGYKSGKIYAQKPLTTDGQLTFTRASTATRVNASGLIETVSSGVPRLDYTNSSCPKILLEPQRSNAMIQSSALNSAFTSQSAAGTGAFTITQNYAAAPDGTTTADRIQMSAMSGGYVDILYPSFTPVSGTVYTYSVYIKSLSGTPVIGFLYDGTVTRFITTSTNWTRHTFTFTGGAVAYPRFLCEPPATSTSADILVWGWQMEAGAYATSYIPTTSAAVTRLADNLSNISATPIIGQTAGTVFVEGYVQDGQESMMFWIKANTGTYTDFIALIFNTSRVPILSVYTGGVLQAYITGSAVTQGYHKIAVAYANNDFAAYVDGVQIGTDTSGTPPTCSQLFLDQYTDGGVRNVSKKQALVFKTRLTNAQLAELTSL